MELVVPEERMRKWQMYNILSLEEYHMKPALLERIWSFSRNETPAEPYIKKISDLNKNLSGSLENEHHLIHRI